MFKFTFRYSDGASYVYEHIKSIYVDTLKTTPIPEDEILTFHFLTVSVKEFYLKSTIGNYTVLAKDLRTIEIEKEL